MALDGGYKDKMKMDNSQSGFSLIEVSLAVLVLGFGLMSLFALFPNGLRMAQADEEWTQTSLFSEKVFSGMHANAQGMTQTNDWQDGSMQDNLCQNVLGLELRCDGSTNAYPPADDSGVRYSLTIDSSVPSARLNVWFGQRGSLAGLVPDAATYTEFFEARLAQ